MSAPERVLGRIRALLARAAHATTPEEEARTSAVQAARLIARHAVPVGPQAPSVAVRVDWQSQSTWYGKPREVGDIGDPYPASVRGRCQACFRGYRKGETIKWRNPIGPVHVSC